MDCCTNDLGNLPHNEDVNIGVVAEKDGEYKALLTYGSAKITRRFTPGIGNDIVVPRPFNETYQYLMEIEDPDGEKVSLEDCTVFAFKTFINIESSCGEEECEEEETDETYS